MNETVRVGLVRSSMVIFWFVIFGTLLYSPLLMRLLSSGKSITVFAWPLEIDPKVLATFEAETGIHVYVSYYESNTELYSKLRATNGKGYDLLIPTHYLIPRLLKHGYIKKLDKQKLPFFPKLRSELLGHYYDPHNEYAIPYFWGIIGLGIDTTQPETQKPTIGWADIFDTAHMKSKVGMTDDPYEAVFMAAQYLFDPLPATFTEEHIAAIQKVLSDQKAFVESYSDTRAGELLASHAVAFATGLSADIWKFRREYPSIGFRLPKEGGLLLIDAMVISSSTTKEDYVYQFINFLYRPDILSHHVNTYAICPPIADIEISSELGSCIHDEDLKKATIFRTIMSQPQINDLWISLMAQ